jgi:tetratricopeptide (TPR) repeat protein
MSQDAGPPAADFGIAEAAALVGWSEERVRRLVRDGVLAPTRGPRGTLRLSFRDLALLRRLRELGGERVPPRRVRNALARLRAASPDSGALSSLALAPAGEVVVREGECLWSPESGQCVFDFAPAREPRVVAFAPRAAEAAPARAPRSADEWLALGCELDESDPARAREAYRAALALEPAHADAHVNLGCLEHAAGRFGAAEAHYRAPLAVRPDDATARFDLAVALEDQRRDAEARRTYEALLADDPDNAEALHNLARLCERQGDRAGALRYWVALRRLLRGD